MISIGLSIKSKMSLQKTAVVVFLTLFVFSLSNCISNQQCEHGYLCVQKSGIGICEKIPGTIELNTEIGVSGNNILF